MANTLRTAAGISLLTLAAACATGKPKINTPTAPPVRGVAMSEDMQARCSAEVSDLVSRLKRNPSLASSGVEVRVPSDEYLTCFQSGLAANAGEQYLLVPTDNPRIYNLVVYKR